MVALGHTILFVLLITLAVFAMRALLVRLANATGLAGFTAFLGG